MERLKALDIKRIDAAVNLAVEQVRALDIVSQAGPDMAAWPLAVLKAVPAVMRAVELAQRHPDAAQQTAHGRAALAWARALFEDEGGSL